MSVMSYCIIMPHVPNVIGRRSVAETATVSNLMFFAQSTISILSQTVHWDERMTAVISK